MSFGKNPKESGHSQQNTSVSDQMGIETQPKFEDDNSEEIDTKRGDDIGNTSSTPTQFICRLCQEQFSQLRFLVKHMALSHFNHIWNAETTATSSENGGGEAAEYPSMSDENPYAVSQTGPYECHFCYEYRTESRNKFIVHLAWRHDVLKPMMGEYADLNIDAGNEYDDMSAPVEDVENDIEGPDVDFNIDDEMEENDDLGDGDEADGEDEYEEETFQTGDQDDVTVDEMEGLNVGEIDVPSDVENESDDEVQIQ